MGRQPCCEKVGLKRGPWTIEEDSKLMAFILNNGVPCWRLVPELAGLMRCGKSCRLRWINYLRPDLKRGAFTEAEEDMIIQLHSRLGNRWSKIAGHFPGRTDNEIKNHWNTRIKKKLKLLGLDPITHTPLLIHPQNSSDDQKQPPQEENISPQNENNDSNKDCQLLQQKEEAEILISGSNQDINESCIKASVEMGSSLMFQNMEYLGGFNSIDFSYQSWMDNSPFIWEGFSNFGDSFP